jgi:fumarate hydratase class II
VALLRCRGELVTSGVCRCARARAQDTFGPIEVASDRYWGAQTQRSLTNFKIGGDDCTMPIEVIKGFGILKKCASRINMANGTLDRPIGEKIIEVSQEIIDGKLDDHFPLVRRCCAHF